MTIRECRICLCADEQSELIAPCLCRGHSKWVHRACLDEWRAARGGADGRSFTHCDICAFEYLVEPHEDDARAERSRRRRYRLLLLRDTVSVFLLMQLFVLGFALMVMGMDSGGEHLRHAFPDALAKHRKTTYYLCGLVIFFAVVGVYGAVQGLCGDDGGGGGRPHRHTCTHCYVGDCNCGDCGDCGGSDSGGGGLLVCLLVIVVVFAVVGLLYSLIAASSWFADRMRKHARKVYLREESKRFVVVDLAARGIAPHGAAAVPARPARPSAPSESDDDDGDDDDDDHKFDDESRPLKQPSAPASASAGLLTPAAPSSVPSAPDAADDDVRVDVAAGPRPPGGPGVSYPEGLF